jgi:hypothetical protein
MATPLLLALLLKKGTYLRILQSLRLLHIRWEELTPLDEIILVSESRIMSVRASTMAAIFKSKLFTELVRFKELQFWIVNEMLHPPASVSPVLINWASCVRAIMRLAFN